MNRRTIKKRKRIERRKRKISSRLRKCITCGVGWAIKPRVPGGKRKCEECREKDGSCIKCGVNRNDCCC